MIYNYETPSGELKTGEYWCDGELVGGWAKTMWVIESGELTLIGYKAGDKSLPKKLYEIHKNK